jgi:hypothetical protein
MIRCRTEDLRTMMSMILPKSTLTIALALSHASDSRRLIHSEEGYAELYIGNLASPGVGLNLHDASTRNR